MKRFIVFALVLFMSVAFGQDSFWKDKSGNPAPDTESRKSKDDFGGWLMVTSDQDWKEKWNTPSDVIPSFKGAKEVHLGERIFILIFFANPKLNSEKIANITCDIRMTRPDMTISIDQKDVTCFRGRIAGSPYNLHLSAPVIGFVGESSDPVGEWVLEVKLKDNMRGTELPLKASFELK